MSTIKRYHQRKPAARLRYKPPGREPRQTAAYAQACKIRSSGAWKSLVNRLRQERPICEWCEERPSEQGHHIKPVSVYPQSALDPDNIWMVCTGCHELIESAVKRGIDLEAVRNA